MINFYIQGGLTTGRTLRILPNTGEKVPQRVVFADEDGVVQVSQIPFFNSEVTL